MIEISDTVISKDRRLDILQSDRRMSLHYAVTRALAEATSLHHAIPNVLQAVCVLGGWDFGEVWLADPDKRVLLTKGHWESPRIKGLNLEAVGRRFSFNRGIEVVGKVWTKGKPIWVSGLLEDDNMPYTATLAKLGVRSLLGTPIINQHEVVGVIVLLSQTLRQIEGDFQEMMNSLGRQVGEFIRRRGAEDALEQNEKRFRALIEHSTDLKLLITSDGRILYSTPSVQRTMGFRAEELAGNVLFDHVHSEDRADVVTFVENLIGHPGDPITSLFRMRHKTGAWLWLETIGTNLLSDLAVQAIVLNARDITSYKRMQDEVQALNVGLEQLVEQRTAQLTAANEELEAFSYSVAHDLRAPLRALNGFTHVVISDHASALDPEGRRLLDMIKSNTIRMGELIDDLLTFSRISRQEIGPVVMVNMNKLVSTILEEFRKDDASLAVNFEIAELPPAVCSAPMIRQVWINIIANAIKFTRHSATPRVVIGTMSNSKEDVYFVKDNGVGFDMRFVNKIFGMFQRLHTSREYDGTGVGLAIVKRIIHRHGGRVWAESEVGKGATIFFSLPKRKEPKVDHGQLLQNSSRRR